MRAIKFFIGSFAAFIFFFGNTGCKKEQLLTSGGRLTFSTDTLNFDTVFTAVGSFTLGLKIFNPESQKVKISSVRLEKGTNSFFRLNVNGIPGNEVSDLELAANDSLYVFATVKIDPNDQDAPFIVQDRLIATMNGKEFSIPFFAYGQNAYYVRDSIIAQDLTWKTDKPYVILHSALVDKGYTLTIPPGARIYMHADSRLYVRGRLICGPGGSKADSVIFQGDRLDRGYFGQDMPGEWGGIYFDSSSTGNIIEWTILKNGGNNSGGGLPFAIEVFGKPGIGTQLTMKNTIIKNSLGYGLLSFGGNIEAENCLVYDCAAQALAIFQGGKYKFTNCDFINYKGPNQTDEPAVVALNYYPAGNNEIIPGDLDADFVNCVLYGSQENEFFTDKAEAAFYQLNLKNCLITSRKALPDYVLAADCILNKNPEFEDADKRNYRPRSGSPLVNSGAPVNLTHDLDGLPRSLPVDIGCYEFQ